MTRALSEGLHRSPSSSGRSAAPFHCTPALARGVPGLAVISLRWRRALGTPSGRALREPFAESLTSCLGSRDPRAALEGTP
jgi:hypothetical protein